MITTIDFNENELKLLEAISAAEGIRTRAECVRFCIKETAKKILPENRTIIVNGENDQPATDSGSRIMNSGEPK